MILTKAAVLFIGAVIVLAQAISPSQYNWVTNTISELAAQNYNLGAIMQAGFIGFGFLLSAGIIRIMQKRRKIDPALLPFLFYALSIAVTGIYSTRPFIAGTSYSEFEHRVHSLFATAAGIFFSLGILAYFFKEKELRRKGVHFAYLVAVLVLSLLFSAVSGYQGVLQRFLYVTGFIWIWYFLE